MRLPRYRAQTIAGRCAFMAQVSGSLPADPNFRPAMKTTCGASGRPATADSSSRSQRIVSTPHASSVRCCSGDEKRETPMTRCVRPAASMARLAIRARVGPILPATPRTITSPSARRIASIAASEGSLSSSSRWATSRIETGISIGGYYASHAPARRRVDPQHDASRRRRRVGALPRQPVESDGAGLAVLPDRGSGRRARRRGRGTRHRHGRDASLRSRSRGFRWCSSIPSLAAGTWARRCCSAGSSSSARTRRRASMRLPRAK